MPGAEHAAGQGQQLRQHLLRDLGASQGLRLRGMLEPGVACVAACAAGCSLFAFGGFDGVRDVVVLRHLRLCAGVGVRGHGAKPSAPNSSIV